MTSNIALITTGGTIGSTITTDSINVSRGESQLKSCIQKLCEEKGVDLSVTSALNKNSEDLTPLDWLALINAVREAISLGISRIIITHGTDTMAYSAAAIALSFATSAVKVVLTGSCYTLDHPKSDVIHNLSGAIEAVTNGQLPDGIYVSFANNTNGIDIIDALHVKPMAFDAQVYAGCFGQRVATIDGQQARFSLLDQTNTITPLSITLPDNKFDPVLLGDDAHRVIQLQCYPGMNAAQLCAGLARDTIVIISPYHSGTAPSLAGAGSLRDTIEQRTDLTFIIAPFPASYIDLPYASSLTLVNSGALLYRDLQPHLLHVLFILGLSAGLGRQEILTQIEAHRVLA